ncbi:P27 family phage terminase small subunit [Lacticaseibacillus suibinensis]|uniref:P27 family phage terminase small subunit n=1 Tax=Lacticaseibacillus suibinensis TaxID=2486011 RepID=UPI0019450393|nr:P27 family phage terminase small subunit [Lacticaseibacillus suibinensis]
MAGKYKVLSQSRGDLTKARQEAHLQAEILAADGLPELQKTPPAYLSTVAKAEYRRIVGSVGKLPLRNLDRAELEAYCTWYATYRQIVEEMNAKPDEYGEHVGDLNKATAAIKGLASDLGLNVNSRMTMNMPKPEKKQESLTDVFS